jgi:outer membrane protein OmpA-like peptidoglycan-associated protein
MATRKWLRWVSTATLIFASSGWAWAEDKTPVQDMTLGTLRAEDVVRALVITDSAQRERAIAINVSFELNSAQLNTGAMDSLDVLGIAMASPELAPLSFRIEGHTDAAGFAEQNQRLSEARANSVHGYLVQKGIDPKRLTAKGFGSSQLLNPAEPLSPVNRRVQVVSVAPQQASSPPSTTVPVKFTYKLHHFPAGGAPEQVVNPYQTAFSAGDSFFLEFSSNLTGLFDLWNQTPDGAVMKLGRWTADPSRPLRLPPSEQRISSAGTPGKELLIVQYYPCRTTTRNHEITSAVEATMIECSKVGDRPFTSDRSRDLAVIPGPGGASAEAQVDVAAGDVMNISMTQFSIPLMHK